uniref:Uncharacterized protein n=1 Tax=Dulem virus 159 TaxID=3145636 RepID=A0AAU8B539_9VIRU
MTNNYDNFEAALISAAKQSYDSAQNSARSDNNSFGQSDVAGAYSLEGASTPSGQSSQGNAWSSLLGGASAVASFF